MLEDLMLTPKTDIESSINMQKICRLLNLGLSTPSASMYLTLLRSYACLDREHYACWPSCRVWLTISLRTPVRPISLVPRRRQASWWHMIAVLGVAPILPDEIWREGKPGERPVERTRAGAAGG
jgi:hypothetical protein